MKKFTCQVDHVGRIMIPSKWRKQHGIQTGSAVILTDEGGRLTLETREQALRRVQKWAATLAPPQVSLVDELIAERREEARREALED